MVKVDQLYQDVILAHNREPRNVGRLEPFSHAADGRNPICGDAVHLTLRVHDGVIRDARFEGDGCAICTASASVLTERVRGRSVAEVEALARAFQSAVREGSEEAVEAVSAAGEPLSALLAVRAFPGRERCATLAWETLCEALGTRGEGPGARSSD